MSDLESESTNESEASDDDQTENNFNFESFFRPYEDQPLAATNHTDVAEQALSESDEDGLTEHNLRQRFEKIVPLQNWCSCGNCKDDRLVLCAEFRCCKEIANCLGRFTFEGLNAGCILTHPDYQAMTNKTVLEHVGPLFTDKKVDTTVNENMLKTSKN
ncbi:hypothetical protein QZH41_019131 [Actinostola sp. cb2023]|nr:hypothetical protein QZH41_019131 [Actinostola sp. cb2023]